MKTSSDLRVLIIGPFPPPFGGIASHLTSLVPGLKAKGWEDVAVVSFGAANVVEENDDAIIYRYNVKNNAYKLIFPGNWGYFFQSLICFFSASIGLSGIIKEATKAMLVCKIANKHNSKVVSTYQADLSLMILPCARIWAGSKKIILTVLGEIYDSPEYFEKRTKVFGKLLAVPHHLIASSDHCANSFRKIGIQRPISTVYFGIDIERFQTSFEQRDQFRSSLGVSQNEILVFYMGRFNEEMGLHSVLIAAKDILEQGNRTDKRIKFLLAGAKGPISTEPQKLSEQYPGYVHVMNDVPFSVQPVMYAASDIVLAPTRDQHACMGMTIKEAMASGKSVIGSISGGIPEAILHDISGILIPLDNNHNIEPKAFKESILYLAENEDVRNRFGMEGRKRAEEIFTASITVDKNANFFEN